MSASWVLMYHRVCPRSPATACWFARGTAVTPEAFEAQLDWLLSRFDVVSLRDLAERAEGGARPRVALTFDDGYAEISSTVAPLCRRRGVTGTCFAAAGPPMLGEPLWFDLWYAIVHSGIGLPSFLGYLREQGAAPTDDLEGLVMGGPKRWLEALHPAARREHLQTLADLTGVRRSSDLYLGLADLRELLSLGWEIGGHGLHHLRLPDCDAREREAEIAASTALLDDVGVRDQRVFAYAHGAHCPRVEEHVRRAGFWLACTVERGSWGLETRPMAVPRLFCRGDGPVPHRLLVQATS